MYCVLLCFLFLAKFRTFGIALWAATWIPGWLLGRYPLNLENTAQAIMLISAASQTFFSLVNWKKWCVAAEAVTILVSFFSSVLLLILGGESVTYGVYQGILTAVVFINSMRELLNE